MSDTIEREVLVVGGGSAGLTAAVALARFGRDVEVIDAGEPRNAPADGVHNLLGREGVSPLELLATGRDELASYEGTVTRGAVVGARRDGQTIELELADGSRRRAARVIVASGVRDALPEVQGLRERWGRDVIHCPYCHGWEVRGERVGILGAHWGSRHQAQLFRELTDDVTLLIGEEPAPEGEDLARLEARGVRIVPGRVEALVVEDDRITGARLADGTVVPLDAVVVGPAPDPTSPVLEALGVARAEHGGYEHDPMFGATPVPGVWVAGNTAQPMVGVVQAMSSGMAAAGGVNTDIVESRIAAALSR